MVSYPIDFVIGQIRLPSHLVLDLLAFYLAFWYYESLRKKKGDHISYKGRMFIVIGAAVGALIFSRLLAALEDPYSFFHPSSLLYYIQGQTIVGGLLGGVIGVEITKKIIGEKSSSGDLFTYPIILGMIIGRIGCLLTGVSDRTVGLPSGLPWAFDQGDGIPRHPTSLYEIIFLLLLWIFLLIISRKVELKNGSLFKIFIVSYLVFRFAIEFIKPNVPLVLGISAIQMACLFGLAYYGIVIYLNRNKNE